MGRGYRKQKEKERAAAAAAAGLRGVSEDGQERIESAHYDEHRENVWEAIRSASQIVSESVGGGRRDVAKAVAGAGLAGLAAGVGAATIAPAAALIAPAAAGFIGWRAYHSWNTSMLWKNSVFGRALAQTFGTDKATGAIKSIGKVLATRSLASLGTAGVASLTLGTPMAPVALAAIGGYAAYKGVQFAMHHRRLEKFDQSQQEAEDNTVIGGMPALEPNQQPGPESANQPADTSQPATETQPEAAPEPSLSPEDSIAMQRASNAARAAEETFRSSVATELGEAALAEGRDFADGIGPEAEEARMLTYLARSRHVEGAANEAEIRRLVGETEAKFYAESEGGQKRLADLKEQYGELEKQKGELAQRAQELESRRAQMEAAGQIGPLSPEVGEALDAEMGRIIQHHGALEQEQEMLAAEANSLSSAKMGEIDGLINLTATGNVLRCARCGTVPQTVRVRCSKCSMPFVASESQREFVGIGDEGLRDKGKMDLVEKYEGDAAMREQRWAAALEGKIIHRKPEEVQSSGTAGGTPAPTSSGEAKTAPSASGALGYSGSNTDQSLASLQPQGEYDREKYLQDQASRRAGDDPEAGMFLVGHDKAKGEGGENADLTQGEAMMQGVMGWDWNKSGGAIQPGDTVAIRRNGKTKQGVKIDGFFTVGEKMELTLPGMKELESLEPGAADKIWGADNYPDPTGVEEMLRKHRPDLMEAVDQVADRVMESTDSEYYPREKVVASILGDLAGSQESTFSFLRVQDPQALDDYYDPNLAGGNAGVGMGTVTLNGTHEDNGSRLSRNKQLVADEDVQQVKKKKGETDEEHEARIAARVAQAEAAAASAEKLMTTVEERRADTVESSQDKRYPQENFNRDAKGQPRVCGVRTAAGGACRNSAVRGSKYCWQHQNGPSTKSGESALSKEEIETSAKDMAARIEGAASEGELAAAQDSIENQSASDAKRVPIGRVEAEAYINSQSNDPAQSKHYAECGMTDQELARYASAFLEACNPKEDEAVGVNIVFEDQRPYAEAIENMARARGMEVIAWYPDQADAATAERIEALQRDGKLITAWVDQVGNGGKMIQGPGAPFDAQRWNMTLTPTQEWANLLAANSELTGFPKDEKEALRLLAEDMQKFTYADRGVNGLRDHIEELEARARRLEELDIKKLRIKDESTGTDLSMEMAPKSQWMTVDMPSGVARPTGNQDDVLANTVTEEVWGTPVPGSLQGTFTSTAPLNLSATNDPAAEPIIIEGIKGRFENGQLVELQAYKRDSGGNLVEDKEAQAKMEQFFFGPDGRPMQDGKPAPFPQCGEVGLVDGDNRVASSGRNYLVPLIDEHGGLHIAIGDSYEINGGGKNNDCSHTGKGTIWEEVHVDITIGGKETSVIGIDSSGKETGLMEKSSWLI